MTNRERAFAISIGSNVGDRMRFLDRALEMLDREQGIIIRATSPIYESAGWGRADLSPFYNAAIAGTTLLEPAELLRRMMRIEDALGRTRKLKWAPRTIDLDLMAVDDMACDDEQLTLPHPWISRRPFFYRPFADVVNVYTGWHPLLEPHEEGRAIEHDTVRTVHGGGVWGVYTPPGDAHIVTHSEERTEALGREIARFLSPGDVVAFDAPMGAGKSVLSRGIARGLGISGPIQSPTYTLCRTYQIREITLEHWDFYRLGDSGDLESAGFHSGNEANAIRLVEWANYFPEALGNVTLYIQVTVLSDDDRRVTIKRSDGESPFFFRALAAKSSA